MIKANQTRIDFLDEFQKMIDEVQRWRDQRPSLKLLAFARRLDAEEKRGLKET
jgi:hypothetical protein